MNDASGLFLGIIAGATLLMALIQVGAIVAILRIARQAQETLASVHRDVKPLLARASEMADEAKPILAKANEVAAEASRTAALATAQAQKVDQLMTILSRRVDETSSIVQQAVVTPAREGMAVVAAIKAALGALRGFNDFRGRTGRPADEDDPLFIG